jgi:hypothetical protein
MKVSRRRFQRQSPPPLASALPMFPALR